MWLDRVEPSRALMGETNSRDKQKDMFALLTDAFLSRFKPACCNHIRYRYSFIQSEQQCVMVNVPRRTSKDKGQKSLEKEEGVVEGQGRIKCPNVDLQGMHARHAYERQDCAF